MPGGALRGCELNGDDGNQNPEHPKQSGKEVGQNKSLKRCVETHSLKRKKLDQRRRGGASKAAVSIHKQCKVRIKTSLIA